MLYTLSGSDILTGKKWNAQATITAESFDTPAKMGNLLIFAPEGTECTYEGNVIINDIAEKKTAFNCDKASNIFDRKYFFYRVCSIKIISLFPIIHTIKISTKNQ